MLQVLSEIILSILCVYGGYRLLHDLADRIERALYRRRGGQSPSDRTQKNETEQGGEESDSNEGK